MKGPNEEVKYGLCALEILHVISFELVLESYAADGEVASQKDNLSGNFPRESVLPRLRYSKHRTPCREPDPCAMYPQGFPTPAPAVPCNTASARPLHPRTRSMLHPGMHQSVDTALATLGTVLLQSTPPPPVTIHRIFPPTHITTQPSNTPNPRSNRMELNPK
ncbi:hypothetical protein P175DRAFT_0529697 [Aspergillus ochraceoroseus IBT 24754]|uniref:Uncharacterized protein n=1 Tax=Aspergillus ochraceoroseus IBT 24754 TaxID=1392256 RepID=A0A2T5M267_9EURO|nr:uncharacterized protein P175DRAFT_0529697 [Aspergillus ochraceoroseus IBT 24754]PTU22625.1 hypothetical protein P175DRAFT_0529697 [Aspergillus ochraceoroseus IBT 24754]